MAKQQTLTMLEWFIESSPLAIVAADKDGIISAINKAMLQNLGLEDPDEVIGKHYCAMLQLAGLEDDESSIFHALRGNSVQNARHTIKGRVLDVSAFTMTNPDNGDAVGAIIMLADITERIRLDAELTRLDRLNLVGEMAASIAHELRNPMTTVRGFLQLLSSKPELHGYKHFTDIMIEEIDRANGIITTYLSLARTSVTTRSCDLSTLVQSFSPILDAEALMHDIRIIYNLADAVPRVNLNEAEIKQLLANLVKNAIESMPPSRSVTISTLRTKAGVSLVVADQGPGIPSELLPKLGTPFVTTKENGTGLGLAVCYRIAERHGARINVDTSSAGSVFTIDFPVPSLELSSVV